MSSAVLHRCAARRAECGRIGALCSRRCVVLLLLMARARSIRRTVTRAPSWRSLARASKTLRASPVGAPQRLARFSYAPISSSANKFYRDERRRRSSCIARQRRSSSKVVVLFVCVCGISLISLRVACQFVATQRHRCASALCRGDVDSSALDCRKHKSLPLFDARAVRGAVFQRRSQSSCSSIVFV